MTFSYSYSELLESVKSHLQYISGKRFGETDAYLRHTASDADLPMLSELTEEALSHVSHRLGIFCSGFAIMADTVEFKLDLKSGDFDEMRQRELRTLLIATLRICIIYRWFLLTGFEGVKIWEEEFNGILESLKERIRAFAPLKERKFPPI